MRDSLALGESYESYFAYLKEKRFDVVVIESATPSWDHDAGVIARIAEVLPEAKIVVTGPIATKGVEILERHPVDACVLGEYEKGVMKVIEGATGVIDYDLLTVEEMNASPYPWLDDSIAHAYWDSNPIGQEGPQLQLLTSRGCPYKCIFCVWPATMTGNDPDGHGKRTVRQYGAAYLEGFITEAVEKYGYRTIYFDDDTFNLGDRHVRMVCDVMTRVGLPWSAMCRADTVSRDTWKLMRDSGCFGVKLGFESGNQYVVDEIVNKHLDLAKAREVVFDLKDLGMMVHGTFTYGLPGETPEQMRDTKDFIASMPLDTLQESGTAEIEGTPLAKLREGGLDKYKGASMDNRYQRDADGAKKMATICASAETLAEDLGSAFDGTVYYMDISLVNNTGHYANACRHFTGELRKRGIPVEVLGPAGCADFLVEELGVRRFFHSPEFRGPSFKGASAYLDHADAMSGIMRANLARMPKLTSKDLLYVNSVEASSIKGLFQWLYRTFTPATMPQVVLEFGYYMANKEIINAEGIWQLMGPLYRHAIQWLPKAYRRRLRLYTFQGRCSREYGAFMDVPVKVFPYPQLPPNLPRYRFAASSQPLVVGFMGHQTGLKGYPLVPGLSLSLLERHEDIRILIHDAAPESNAQVSDAVRKLEALDNRVEAVFQSAGKKEWWALLDRVDLLVLPYVKERYQHAYSAILAEAISSGLPVVAPADTALSELMEAMGMPGVLFEDWDHDSILTAIEDGLTRFDDIARRANRAAVAWMRGNGPEALVDELLYGGIPRPMEELSWVEKVEA
jgi:glycosyltransferase involved in cell wall biosynthesis/tRNA A37 methylthiotransferase MiaB